MIHTQMLLNRLGSERQRRHNRILQRVGIDEPFFTQTEAAAVADTVKIYDCKGLLTPNEMRALLGLPEIKEGVKKKMRAREKRVKDQQHTDAMYSLVKSFHADDPEVIERFKRPPYWPVLSSLTKIGGSHERKTKSKEV
jgi:hypothetical protein